MRRFFFRSQSDKEQLSLKNFWKIDHITKDGVLVREKSNGFMYVAEGMDGSFLSNDQLHLLHQRWRSVLRFLPNEEIQVVFRKRVAFTEWIEEQLTQSFLADSSYGRKILLDRLGDQLLQMSSDEPVLFSQKIIICFWTNELMDTKSVKDKRELVQAQLNSFGFKVRDLDKDEVIREIAQSAQDLQSCEQKDLGLPFLEIKPDHLKINCDDFRALELKKLPEHNSSLGMVQSITRLPFPLDVVVRLKSRDVLPVIARLERKRNLLHTKRGNKASNAPDLEVQIKQIDQVLESLTTTSESIFEMKMIIGIRLPKESLSFQRKALNFIQRAGHSMDFSEFEETTLGTFDAYLECLPSFSGENIRTHTILGSNAIHFLPFFRPSKGDCKAVISFQTKEGSLYGIDPVASHLANYNWLVTGTSGAGKSFFVNSILAQCQSLNPNIFIIDIGGSYNKLTQFLNGRVLSLETHQGFELSPFFLPKCDDSKEEKIRRQHIFQIFLEMTRVDGELPSIEIRHLLWEALDKIFNMDVLPVHPISHLIHIFSQTKSKEAYRLEMLLKAWCGDSFLGGFLDNDNLIHMDERILTFDLKGLTEFEELSRVVQLIICARLWAKIRQSRDNQFSWVVLDEVAFSLLKTQPQFVDELVSTLRKYYAGVVIIVQDLEKVTSNFAGSSILQNTNTKAILQQRGNPKNYADVFSLEQVDRWAIESLQREKGSFSDIFLIRNNDRVVVRHRPSRLEYWLATTAPEDSFTYSKWSGNGGEPFQKKIVDFVASRKGASK